ncbi:MAG: hypothetical protein K2J17_08360, partial [Paramuribaculum sp.]|nr:hypothetical protein [Paramuribaculum sp.]
MPRITIQPMTAAEYRDGARLLTISYSFATTPFGDILIASTLRGVCALIFADDRAESLSTLRADYPCARFVEQITDHHDAALQAIGGA